MGSKMWTKGAKHDLQLFCCAGNKEYYWRGISPVLPFILSQLLLTSVFQFGDYEA